MMLKLTKGSSHAENASQEGAKGPGAPLHGGHRLHRDPGDLFGMAKAQPREHQHRPHLQVQRWKEDQDVSLVQILQCLFIGGNMSG